MSELDPSAVVKKEHSLVVPLTRAMQPGRVSPGGSDQATRYPGYPVLPCGPIRVRGKSLPRSCYSIEGVWGSRPRLGNAESVRGRRPRPSVMDFSS